MWRGLHATDTGQNRKLCLFSSLVLSDMYPFSSGILITKSSFRRLSSNGEKAEARDCLTLSSLKIITTHHQILIFPMSEEMNLGVCFQVGGKAGEGKDCAVPSPTIPLLKLQPPKSAFGFKKKSVQRHVTACHIWFRPVSVSYVCSGQKQRKHSSWSPFSPYVYIWNRAMMNRWSWQ